MARRYVRDKLGRFASHGGGGGSFGGGGKIGKSAKNVKARAAYKNQAGKLREAKKMAKGRMTTKREQKYWNQQLGGAKSGYTRVANRLAGKGKSAAAQKALGSGGKQTRGLKKRRGRKTYDNTTNTSIKMKTVKKNLRRKYPQSKAAKSLEKRVAAKAKKKGVDYINMTKRQYSKVHKDFKGSDPKNPRTLKYVEGKGTVLKPVKFVKKYNQTDAFAESKAKRGSAATKRDRILRTAKRNLIRGGPSGPSAARRRKRMQMAEDIMTKAMGGSTAWKNFGPRF